MMETYKQQIGLPEIGIEGQMKLLDSSVLVVGVGGLGCAALPYLAASGIQRIGLVDFDKVEASNLARQVLFGPLDIGRHKVEVAAERLSQSRSSVHQSVCQLTADNAKELILPYDIVVDATDNLQARLAINDACRCLQKPWVYGSIDHWAGQVALFAPGQPDYRSLFPEGTSVYSPLNCSAGGVLGPFVGLVGAIQAVETIKSLTGIQDNLAGKLLLIDGKTWRMSVVGLTVRESNFEISYAQLQAWMSQETLVLMDAREMQATLPANTRQKIVVYCQSGRRSLELAHRLRQQGFEAYSLQGGVGSVKC